MAKRPIFKKGDKVYVIISKLDDGFFVLKGKLIRWNSIWRRGTVYLYFRPNIFPKNKSIYDLIDCYEGDGKIPIFAVGRDRMVHVGADNAEEIVKKKLERILIRYANSFSKEKKRFEEKEKKAYKRLTILRQPKKWKLSSVNEI